VQRVVQRFVELQGEDLNEGLVFREFVPLKIVELGDGQVAGLPSQDLAPEFFGRIAAAHAHNAPA